MEWGARGAQCDRTVGLSGDARDGRTHLGTGEVGGDHNGEGLESRAQKRGALVEVSSELCVRHVTLARAEWLRERGWTCLLTLSRWDVLPQQET